MNTGAKYAILIKNMKAFLVTGTLKLIATVMAILQFFLATPKHAPTPPSPIHIPETVQVEQIPEISLSNPFSILSPDASQMENIQPEKFFPLSPKKTSAENPLPQVANPAKKILDPRLHGWDVVNEKISPAVVNIFCTLQTGNIIRTSTGSGVIIDPRGVILTNAHIAQYFLLENPAGNPKTNCEIRSGNPAKGNAPAKILYISPRWIEAHGLELLDTHPMGTGEYDYALIMETGTHPFAPLADDTIAEAGEDAIIAGYPSPLTSLSSRDNLYFISALTQITKTQELRNGASDLLYFGGSLLAERGSSGGPVVNESGKVIGILVTATSGISVDSRESRAISASYIRKSFLEESGMSMENFLAGNLETARQNFMSRYGNNLGEKLLQNFH